MCSAYCRLASSLVVSHYWVMLRIQVSDSRFWKSGSRPPNNAQSQGNAQQCSVMLTGNAHCRQPWNGITQGSLERQMNGAHLVANDHRCRLRRLSSQLRNTRLRLGANTDVDRWQKISSLGTLQELSASPISRHPHSTNTLYNLQTHRFRQFQYNSSSGFFASCQL